MTILEELSVWASGLTLQDVPERVVALATSQVLSQLAAARAGLGHPIGRAVVAGFGSPLQADPKQAACALAGLTSWLQMDDTAYAGHLGNSTVTVPLSYARAGRRSGRALLQATIAANECAARITAAATLGPFRGQSATHTALVGAVAGRLRLAGADCRTWVNAFALALGMPPRVLSPAFLTSDTKVLNALVPVRAGLDACDAALAGLTGAADVIEHPDGFLSRFSSVPLPDVITHGLGSKWHTDTLSFKMHPAGPGVDAAVDCAIEIAAGLGGALTADDIAEVVVHSSWYTVFLDRRVAALVTGPDAALATLVVSTPYTVATALLTGDLVPADMMQPRLGDPQRWALAGRIRVEHDPEMTRDSFRCEVPFGEALRMAGDRAAEWEFAALREPLAALGLGDLTADLGEPSKSFAEARKVTGARVTVRLRDGRTVTRQRDIPRGAAGPDTRARHAELVREKFLRTGGSAQVADAIAELESLPGERLARTIDAAIGAGSGAPATARVTR
jgi:2-methylcitrate dehydratase PrpD